MKTREGIKSLNGITQIEKAKGKFCKASGCEKTETFISVQDSP